MQHMQQVAWQGTTVTAVVAACFLAEAAAVVAAALAHPPYAMDEPATHAMIVVTGQCRDWPSPARTIGLYQLSFYSI
jgi:hypothetical protein